MVDLAIAVMVDLPRKLLSNSHTVLRSTCLGTFTLLTGRIIESDE
jgi:hypothetical protein